MAAVFGALGLVAFGTLFVMTRAWHREQVRLHQFWNERRERLERENEERQRESQP